MARTKLTESERIKIAERRSLALDHRKAGLSYRAIGKKLGISYVQARRDIEAELAILAKERTDKAEEMRQLELERLDMLTNGLEPMAKVGNPGAVNSFLRVMERRAKLLGLDAPAKMDLNVDVSTLSDDELRAIIEGKGSSGT